MLGERLRPLRRETSPFEGRQPQQDAVFAEPELVAEVEFAEWTSAGHAAPPLLQGPARRQGAGGRGAGGAIAPASPAASPPLPRWGG